MVSVLFKSPRLTRVATSSRLNDSSPHAFLQLTQDRMCMACEVTFERQITGAPSAFSDYTPDCLAEVAKVTDWLIIEGYCEENYVIPLCINEAFDPIGNPEEGPNLGVARSLNLESLGSRQSDRTDVRSMATIASENAKCLCTQAPESCACRDNVWARRPGV